MLVYLQMIETDDDKSKFEQIYIEYYGLMLHTAFKLLNHKQDAEDAVHHAFVSIAENITKISAPVCPKTKRYVVTIVENKAIDILRKRQRYPVTAFDDEIKGIDVEYDGDDYLVECIFKLPALQRQVILLKYSHGYSLREIAKMLGISHIWAIKVDQRAKKKLKKLYEERG